MEGMFLGGEGLVERKLECRLFVGGYNSGRDDENAEESVWIFLG